MSNKVFGAHHFRFTTAALCNCAAALLLPRHALLEKRCQFVRVISRVVVVIITKALDGLSPHPANQFRTPTVCPHPRSRSFAIISRSQVYGFVLFSYSLSTLEAYFYVTYVRPRQWGA